MSPLSDDPQRRQRQLQNLRRGGNPTPGNNFRRSHGGYGALAREAVDEQARKIIDALEADVPVPGAWSVPIRLLAETLLRLDSVTDHVRRRGWEDDDGNLRPAADLEDRLQHRAIVLARELGLTPMAASKLGLNVARGAAAFDLAAHWANEEDDTIDVEAVDG